MSLFGTILSKILGHAQAGATETPAAGPATTARTGAPDPAAAPTSTPASASPSAASATPVDVEAVLTEMASHSAQHLNWRTSIVDLMKLLGLDSSLEQRKLLANELNYDGDETDSAAMNVWLHKQVMAKLADNGGVVPDSLRA